MVVLQVTHDEARLIEIVRNIKNGVGFGEFAGTVTHREITTIREGYTHKLK